MKKWILLCALMSANAFAQTSADDQFQRQIDEIMKAREEMLKSLMDDSNMGEFENRMREMMKRFAGPDFDMSDFESPVIGQYDWVVTDTQKILKLKVQQAKDHPLDIKIEQGMIKIKGDVVATQGTGKNKSTRKTSFERSFSLPDDVDQTNPEFENKDGEVLIKFKRLSAGKVPSKTSAPAGKVKAKDTQAPKNDRIPVVPGSDDLKI